MAAILLNNTLYNKGGHKGKSTTGYKDIVQEYSKQVGSLTGKQIELLYPFVDKYNEDALIALQTEILKKEVKCQYQTYQMRRCFRHRQK